ncbi:MAG TPA: rhombosortase [Gammaproteobacteria bacterium]|nr:rhombosortase [Gammaproteobacteria bacterium]
MTIAVLAAVLLAATLQLSPAADALQALFRYERAAVLDGQWWRLFTAHWVHLGSLHLALNLLALLLVLLLCRPAMSTLQALVCLLLYAPLVSLGLLLFNPDIDWYAGLSGVLHGLLVTCGWLLVRSRPAAILLLAGVLVKLFAEQSGAWSSGTGHWLGEPVIVDAHLYGAVAGLLGALVHQAVRTTRERPIQLPAGRRV